MRTSGELRCRRCSARYNDMMGSILEHGIIMGTSAPLWMCIAIESRTLSLLGASCWHDGLETFFSCTTAARLRFSHRLLLHDSGGLELGSGTTLNRTDPPSQLQASPLDITTQPSEATVPPKQQKGQKGKNTRRGAIAGHAMPQRLRLFRHVVKS